jgi:hypothetical protein
MASIFHASCMIYPVVWECHAILMTDKDNTFFTITLAAFNGYQLSRAAVLYHVAGL